MNKLFTFYATWPKWLRFAIEYGTMPVWVPIFTVILIPVFAVVGIIHFVEATWRNFE